MNQDNPEDDFALLTHLRAQARRVEELEQRIAELERDHHELLDSSGRIRSELESYQQIKKEWEWFFDHSPDLLGIAGVDGYFKRVNRAFSETLGYHKDELLSLPFQTFVHPDDAEATNSVLHELGTGKDCIYFENRYRDSAGNYHWLAWRCPGTAPGLPQIYAIARDITESKRSEAEIMHRATHDSLTGLSNRAAFDIELAHALARVGRKPNEQIALFMIDLNGFKNVNDTRGHAAGDELLKMVAARFLTIQRRSDQVFRLGGDEFVWLVEGTIPIEIDVLAARLIEAIRLPLELDGVCLTIGCSIGISTFPNPAADARTLNEQADAAMYQVKKTGKDGFFLFK